MPKLKFRCERDPSVYYKKGNLKIGQKKVETPIKSLDLYKITKTTPMNPQFRGVNESLKVFHQFKKVSATKSKKILYHSLEDYMSSTALTESIGSGYGVLESRAKMDEISIFFTEFEGERYPTDREIRYIITDSHRYSDIVPLPILSNMPETMDYTTFKKYLDFLERAYTEIDMINNKPIMGIVPRIGPAFIPDLVEFYTNKDINSFFFNFDGRTPTTMYQYFVNFFKELHSYGEFEKSYIHAINVNLGRTSKEKDVVDSKDILSFGYGIDGLGRLSKPRISKEALDKIDTSTKKIRLFDKDDYGAYRLKTTELKSFLNGKHTGVSQKSLEHVFPSKSDKKKYPDTRPVDIFNTEQLGLEACRLRKVIPRGDGERYLDTKAHACEKDKVQIKSMREQIKSKPKSKQARLTK